MKKLLGLALVVTIILVGCLNKSTLTTEEIMKQNALKDVFVFQNVVYLNAENNEGVMNKVIAKDDEVGKIEYRYEPITELKSGTATQLPIGAKIYQPKPKLGPVLIIEVDGKELRYLGLVEG